MYDNGAPFGDGMNLKSKFRIYFYTNFDTVSSFLSILQRFCCVDNQATDSTYCYHAVARNNIELKKMPLDVLRSLHLVQSASF